MTALAVAAAVVLIWSQVICCLAICCCHSMPRVSFVSFKACCYQISSLSRAVMPGLWSSYLSASWFTCLLVFISVWQLSHLSVGLHICPLVGSSVCWSSYLSISRLNCLLVFILFDAANRLTCLLVFIPVHLYHVSGTVRKLTGIASTTALTVEIYLPFFFRPIQRQN